MSDLIADIRAARAFLRAEEERTTSAAIELRNCKDRERKARGELDALLDALESGVDPRYPLFPEQPPADGNGQASAPTAIDAAPLRGRGKRARGGKP